MLEKLYYDSTINQFLKSTEKEYETIKEPVIVIDTLHSCYAHAVIDNIFPYWQVIEEIGEPCRLFITKQNIEQFPKNLELIEGNKYKNVYNELIELLTSFPLYFEHQLTGVYKFRCYIYPINNYDRSIWNSNYIGRSYVEPKYTDDYLFSKVKEFKNFVLKKYNIEPPREKKIIIINRYGERAFMRTQLNLLIQLVSQNFGGIYYLEELTFREQVELFATSSIIIYTHGAGAINLIFSPENSIAIEFSHHISLNKMYKRICDSVSIKHIVLNVDYIEDEKYWIEPINYIKDFIFFQ